MHRRCRTDVLDDAAHVRRQAATGDLAIRHELHELVFPTRRVDRRHLFQHDAIVAEFGECFAEARDGFGFVALNDDIACVYLKRMHEYLCAAQYCWRTFTHEYVVATDVWLALDAIENEELNVAGTCLHELLRRRKYSATQADDAAIEDS